MVPRFFNPVSFPDSLPTLIPILLVAVPSMFIFPLCELITGEIFPPTLTLGVPLVFVSLYS